MPTPTPEVSMRISPESSRAAAALRTPAAVAVPGRMREPAAAPGSVTHLSTAAEVVLGLRSQAAQASVRPDAVAQIRAELAAGTLGTPEDIDATVDALLLELT